MFALVDLPQLSFPEAFERLSISGVKSTGRRLGAGAYGSVEEVDWVGTICAAKTLHPIFFEFASQQAQDKLIKSFAEECLTWSSLRHPGVVQFLGVYSDIASRLPILVMEKMDTSLRTYFENHSKENFSLHLKAYVLRQVSQALAYLHSQSPPLVHHDLNPNNVLLNAASFVTKLSDFGMSRAIDPSSLTRKSSVKGTPAFMAPEALLDPPQYDEKLDVFSYGNVIISTITHEWPNPGPPNRSEGDQLVALNELQRRQRYVEMFTPQEKLFLPTVCRCLENRPDKRPSSAVLVQDLRCMESSLPSGSHVAAPIEQLAQQLSAKEEECREKNMELLIRAEALKEKDEALREKDSDIAQLKDALLKKDLRIFEMSEEQEQKDKIINELSESLQTLSFENPLQNGQEENLFQSRDLQIPKVDSLEPTPGKVAEHGSCKVLGTFQKIIRHSRSGGRYKAIAINQDGLIAVTDESNKHVHLIRRDRQLITTIKKLQLGGELGGVAFDGEGNIWVADSQNGRVVNVSQDGLPLHTIKHLRKESDRLKRPTDIAISPKGHVYICDYGENRISVHDQSGKFLLTFGSKVEGDCPTALTFAPDGLLYVCDAYSRIRAYQVELAEKPSIVREVVTQVYKPSGVAPTADGHLIVTSSTKHKLMVYTTTGELVHSFGEHGVKPGQLDSPCGIAVDNVGNVFVADNGNKGILVFR